MFLLFAVLPHRHRRILMRSIYDWVEGPGFGVRNELLLLTATDNLICTSLSSFPTVFHFIINKYPLWSLTWVHFIGKKTEAWWSKVTRGRPQRLQSEGLVTLCDFKVHALGHYAACTSAGSFRCPRLPLHPWLICLISLNPLLDICRWATTLAYRVLSTFSEMMCEILSCTECACPPKCVC